MQWPALKILPKGRDLTIHLEVMSNDEMGELAKWFNLFIEKIRGVVKSIAENAEALGDASLSLFELSNHMSQGAESMSSNSNSVASSSEEMSTNMNSVASAMEQTATNVGMVASSIEV